MKPQPPLDKDRSIQFYFISVQTSRCYHVIPGKIEKKIFIQIFITKVITRVRYRRKNALNSLYNNVRSIQVEISLHITLLKTFKPDEK